MTAIFMWFTTSISETRILVNIGHIIQVQPMETQEGSILWMEDGRRMSVKEPVDYILNGEAHGCVIAGAWSDSESE